MHTKPLIADFHAVAISKGCVIVNFDRDLDLTDSKIILLGSSRSPIISISVTGYRMEVSVPTGDPMFAELKTPHGTCVKYVTGSGKDMYFPS
jgi:hypothetical protein